MSPLVRTESISPLATDEARLGGSLRPGPVAPLPAAGPVTDLRPTLAAHLQQRLGVLSQGFRHNIALLGMSGSGKSHLAQQALRQLDAGFLKIYCPLQSASASTVVRQLTVAVLRAIVEDREGLPLEELLTRVSPTAPKTAEAARRLIDAGVGHVPAEAIVQALDLVPIAHGELRRPCVLVLDEFLVLGQLGTQLFHEVGKRVVTWPYTVFVLTSSSPLKGREILRERLQLLFGQFELIALGHAEPTAAIAWMEQELSATPEADGLLRLVLEWTGPSVWALKVLVKRMRELTVLMGQPARLEVILTRALWDVLGSRDGVLHQWYAAKLQRLDGVRYGMLARDALLAVARGAKTTHAVCQAIGARRHVSQALQVLIEQDVVVRRGACWLVPDQLLKLWLTSVHDPVQPQSVADPVHPGEPFERAARRLAGEWLQASRLSLTDQVQALFARFQNETIALEHKTGRLPAFQSFRAVRSDDGRGTFLVADAGAQRWCCLIDDRGLSEPDIAAFRRFCQQQSPRPARAVVIAYGGLELNVKLVAKDAGMWVWEPDDLRLLSLLYGQAPPERA